MMMKMGKDQLLSQYTSAAEAAINMEKRMRIPAAAGSLKMAISWNIPKMARKKNASMMDITAEKWWRRKTVSTNSVE
jgi:hypothetical protein